MKKILIVLIFLLLTGCSSNNSLNNEDVEYKCIKEVSTPINYTSSTREYFYDNNGNMIKRTKDGVDEITYEYNSENLPIRSESSNFITEYTYDEDNNVIKTITSKDGSIYSETNFEYENNNKVKSTHKADDNILVTLFEHDENSNLVKVDNYENNELISYTESIYDDNSNNISMTTYVNDVVASHYDKVFKNDLLISQEISLRPTNDLTDDFDIINLKYEYDSNGNLISELEKSADTYIEVTSYEYKKFE
jgi:hypothetical protein